MVNCKEVIGKMIRCLKRSRLFIAVVGMGIIFVVLLKRELKVFHISQLKEDLQGPIILWWTPFTGIRNIVKKCKYGSCLFTEDRDQFQVGNNLSVILFYGSNFQIEDLPLPRKAGHWWGLLHEESPKNQPLFDHQPALSLFNLTSTFKQESGLPLTLLYLQSIDSLTSKQYFVSYSEKNKLLKTENLSPVFYLQSDCNPPSQRDKYVKELLKYISVDSYGLCLNNKKLPAHLVGIESMTHPEILRLIAKYKFTIAFENSACGDYMTEKLWRPLVAGSVPIYWGSPSVENWLPNKQSIIHVRDFKTPRELAFHILKVLDNSTMYNMYLKHKTGKISNSLLVNTLKDRPWGINEDQETRDTFVEAFECFVCDKVFELYKTSEPGSLMADESHYGCPVPETMLTNLNPAGFWVEQWYKSAVEAEVLFQMVSDSKAPFTMDVFYEKVIALLQSKNHFNKFLQLEL